MRAAGRPPAHGTPCPCPTGSLVDPEQSVCGAQEAQGWGVDRQGRRRLSPPLQPETLWLRPGPGSFAVIFHCGIRPGLVCFYGGVIDLIGNMPFESSQHGAGKPTSSSSGSVSPFPAGMSPSTAPGSFGLMSVSGVYHPKGGCGVADILCVSGSVGPAALAASGAFRILVSVLWPQAWPLETAALLPFKACP